MKKKNNGLNASPKYYVRLAGFSSKYFVQVGAFSDKSNAEKFLKSVKKDYPEAFIKTF